MHDDNNEKLNNRGENRQRNIRCETYLTHNTPESTIKKSSPATQFPTIIKTS